MNYHTRIPFGKLQMRPAGTYFTSKLRSLTLLLSKNQKNQQPTKIHWKLIEAIQIHTPQKNDGIK
jgi:hypothetical protein